MAFRFDDTLEHRETIVTRVPRSWRLHGWFVDGSCYAISVGGAAAAGLLGLDPASLLALGAALAGIVGYSLYYYAGHWSHEAVVTDRRLLCRTGWRNPTLAEIRVEEVASVEATQDKLRVIRPDGTALHFSHAQGSRALAEALAREARVAPPRAGTQREAVADYVFILAAMVGGLATAIPLLKLVYPHLSDWEASVGWVLSGGGFLFFGWLAHLIGFVFGGHIVSIFLLRPLLRFEEMDAWLAHSPAFWPDPSVPKTPEDTLSRRLARLLYGRPPPPPPAGGADHG